MNPEPNLSYGQGEWKIIRNPGLETDTLARHWGDAYIVCNDERKLCECHSLNDAQMIVDALNGE